MLTFLSIALLFIGVASTACAFGGKTWNEGPERFIERITPRGWISLILLLLAFGIGVCKELYSNKEQAQKNAADETAAKEARNDSDRKQDDLRYRLNLAQSQLETSNAKIEGLELQLRATEDQISGGSGFPIATVSTAFPINDGGYSLWTMPSGKAPVYDVSYNVTEGAYKQPTPEEFQKLMEQAKRVASGEITNSSHFIGTLLPQRIVPMGYIIHPSTNGINTYRILFDARNGMVLETMEVKFDDVLRIWQFRLDIRSQSPETPNKLLWKQDWEPKRQPVMLFGEGPPHNH